MQNPNTDLFTNCYRLHLAYREITYLQWKFWNSFQVSLFGSSSRTTSQILKVSKFAIDNNFIILLVFRGLPFLLLYISTFLRHSNVLPRSSHWSVFRIRWNDFCWKTMSNICRYLCYTFLQTYTQEWATENRAWDRGHSLNVKNVKSKVECTRTSVGT